MTPESSRYDGDDVFEREAQTCSPAVSIYVYLHEANLLGSCDWGDLINQAALGIDASCELTVGAISPHRSLTGIATVEAGGRTIKK